jgi:fatty acid desaturase
MVQTKNRLEQEPASTAEAERHSEGEVAKLLENQTAKLPSDVWLWAAVGSMGVALTLQMLNKKHASLFVGQWPAPFLLLGVYNKLIKIAGSDRTSESQER